MKIKQENAYQIDFGTVVKPSTFLNIQQSYVKTNKAITVRWFLKFHKNFPLLWVHCKFNAGYPPTWTQISHCVYNFTIQYNVSQYFSDLWPIVQISVTA